MDLQPPSQRSTVSGLEGSKSCQERMQDTEAPCQTGGMRLHDGAVVVARGKMADQHLSVEEVM